MRRIVVERVILPMLRALHQPLEQLWVGITLVTLFVMLFVHNRSGTNTGNSSVNTQGNYRSPSNLSQVATIHPTSPSTQPITTSRTLENIKLPKEIEPIQPKNTFAVFNK